MTLPKGHRAPVLVDQEVLHERAAEVLTVVLGLDRPAWRAATAGRPVVAGEIVGDLRLASWSLGAVLRAAPRSGVEVSELLLRRWALRWLTATARTVAGRLPAGPATRQLVAATAAAEQLDVDAGGHLRRIHPTEVRRAQRRAQARIASVLTASPAWRLEVLRRIRPGAGAAGGEASVLAAGGRPVLVFDVHLVDVVLDDPDAQGYEPVCERLYQLANGRLEHLDAGDDEGYRVAVAWRLAELGRLDHGDLVRVTGPSGRIEVWLCTCQAPGGWWLQDVLDHRDGAVASDVEAFAVEDDELLLDDVAANRLLTPERALLGAPAAGEGRDAS